MSIVGICCRKYLKHCGLLENSYTAQKLADQHVAVPVCQQFVTEFGSQTGRHVFKDIEFCLSSMNLQKKRNHHRPVDSLLSAVKSLCISRSLWQDELASDLPRTWEKHGDLLLLPSCCFLLDVWKLLGNLHSL